MESAVGGVVGGADGEGAGGAAGENNVRFDQRFRLVKSCSIPVMPGICTSPAVAQSSTLDSSATRSCASVVDSLHAGRSPNVDQRAHTEATVACAGLQTAWMQWSTSQKTDAEFRGFLDGIQRRPPPHGVRPLSQHVRGVHGHV